MVEFHAFVDVIATASGERPSAAEIEVLVHMVDTHRFGAVSIFRFAEFARAFGPIGSRCMANLRAIVSQPWFCGFLTARESELMLFNQPPGAFLLRMASTGSGAAFSLAHLLVNGIAVVHIEIIPQQRGASFMSVSPDGATQTGPFATLPLLIEAFVAHTAGKPLQHALANEPWFHGDLTSSEAADLLASKAVKTFLVRFSGNSNGSFAMSWLDGVNMVSHVRFNKQLAGFVVENHVRVFASIVELIDHYKDLLKTPLENPQAKLNGLMLVAIQQRASIKSASPPPVVRRAAQPPPTTTATTTSTQPQQLTYAQVPTPTIAQPSQLTYAQTPTPPTPLPPPQLTYAQGPVPRPLAAVARPPASVARAIPPSSSPGPVVARQAPGSFRAPGLASSPPVAMQPQSTLYRAPTPAPAVAAVPAAVPVPTPAPAPGAAPLSPFVSRMSRQPPRPIVAAAAPNAPVATSPSLPKRALSMSEHTSDDAVPAVPIQRQSTVFAGDVDDAPKQQPQMLLRSASSSSSPSGVARALPVPRPRTATASAVEPPLSPRSSSPIVAMSARSSSIASQQSTRPSSGGEQARGAYISSGDRPNSVGDGGFGDDLPPIDAAAASAASPPISPTTSPRSRRPLAAPPAAPSATATSRPLPQPGSAAASGSPTVSARPIAAASPAQPGQPPQNASVFARRARVPAARSSALSRPPPQQTSPPPLHRSMSSNDAAVAAAAPATAASPFVRQQPTETSNYGSVAAASPFSASMRSSQQQQQVTPPSDSIYGASSLRSQPAEQVNYGASPFAASLRGPATTENYGSAALMLQQGGAAPALEYAMGGVVLPNGGGGGGGFNSVFNYASLSMGDSLGLPNVPTSAPTSNTDWTREMPDLKTPQSTAESVQRAVKLAQAAIATASKATTPVSTRRLAIVVSALLKPLTQALAAIRALQTHYEPLKHRRELYFNTALVDQLCAPFPALNGAYSAFSGDLQRAIAACGDRRPLVINAAVCALAAQGELFRQLIDFLPWAAQVLGGMLREPTIKELFNAVRASCGRAWIELLAAAVRPIHTFAAAIYALLRHTPRSHADAAALCALLPLFCGLSGSADRAWRIADNFMRLSQASVSVRGADAFGPLVKAERVLLCDVEVPGRFSDASDKKMKKPRDLRLLVFSDQLLWCKVENGAATAVGRIPLQQVVVKALPAEGDMRHMLELMDQDTQLPVRVLAPSQAMRQELQTLLQLLRSATGR